MKKNIIISSIIGIVVTILLCLDNFALIGFNEKGIWGDIGFALLFIVYFLGTSVAMFLILNFISNRKKVFQNKGELILSIVIAFVITILLFHKHAYVLRIYELEGLIIYSIFTLCTFMIISTLIYKVIIKLENKKKDKALNN